MSDTLSRFAAFAADIGSAITWPRPNSAKLKPMPGEASGTFDCGVCTGAADWSHTRKPPRFAMAVAIVSWRLRGYSGGRLSDAGPPAHDRNRHRESRRLPRVGPVCGPRADSAVERSACLTRHGL